MNRTSRSRNHKHFSLPRPNARTPEDDLLDVAVNLRDAAKDSVLGVARVWRAIRPDARADQLLLASVDVLERTEQVLGAAFEHAPVPKDNPK